MKTFASPLQLLSLLSNSSSFADTKKKENNEIKQARKGAYELGERHYMQTRLKIPNELGYFVGETLIYIACGYGKYLCYFKFQKKIKNCVGLHLKKKAIHSTKRLFRKRGIDIPLILGGAQNLPFKDDTFDVAFSTDRVEYLPNSPK